MKTLLDDKQIRDITNYLDEPNSLSEQKKRMSQIRKRDAISDIVFGAFGLIAGIIAILGALSPELRILDFLLGNLPSSLPSWLRIVGGVIFVFCLAGVVIGPYGIIRGISKFRDVYRFSFVSDLDELCRIFYTTVFYKQGVPKNKLETVCWTSLPMLVLENYLSLGWKSLGTPRGYNYLHADWGPPMEGPIECNLCGKKAEQSQQDSEFPVGIIEYTKNPKDFSYTDYQRKFYDFALQRGFLKCKYCDFVMCYACLVHSVPEYQAFLCPNCLKATLGWSGLSRRWSLARRSIKDRKFTIHIDKTPRSDQRIVDIKIYISGMSTGEKITFSNVAICFDEKWFLATPEPVFV